MNDLHSLLDSENSDVLFSTLNCDGTFLSVTNGCQRILGFSSDELLGRYSYVLADHPVRRYFRRQKNNALLMMECLLHKQDGDKHLLMERAVFNYVEDSTILFGGKRRDTRSKMGVVEVSQAGVIKRWEIEDLTGISAEATCNKSLEDFVPPHEFNSLMRYLSQFRAYAQGNQADDFVEHGVRLNFRCENSSTVLLEIRFYVLLDSIVEKELHGRVNRSGACEEVEYSFVGMCSICSEDCAHMDTAASFETYLKDFVENGSVGLHWVGIDGIIKVYNHHHSVTTVTHFI